MSIGDVVYSEVKHIADMFYDALDKASENMQSAEIKINGRISENKKSFSISKNLRKDLMKILDEPNQKKSEEIYIGETSNFLTDVIEAKKLSCTMPRIKAYKAMVNVETAKKDGKYEGDDSDHYHDLGIDGLISALSAAENPVFAFAATDDIGEIEINRGNHIVLVTDNIKNGSYVIVIQALDVRGRLNNAIRKRNKFISVYDK